MEVTMAAVKMGPVTLVKTSDTTYASDFWSHIQMPEPPKPKPKPDNRLMQKLRRLGER